MPTKGCCNQSRFWKGNPHADILFISEAPGKEEDLQGKPFVGSAGKNLDKFLQSIGLRIDDVYIANILKYRPPKNRNPTTEEIKRHTPYLIEQIYAIKPKVIVTLGNFSTKFVLTGFSVDGMSKIPGITALHGEAKEIEVKDAKFTVIPMYHPAAMLYRRQLEEVIYADFAKMAELLGLDTDGAVVGSHDSGKDKSLLEF